MAFELAELLDHEQINGKVHAIGHDFGALPCSRLLNYFPARVASAVFMCGPYIAPGTSAMDVDAMEKMTKEMVGYEVFGYWRFFVKPTTGKLLIEHMSGYHHLERGYMRLSLEQAVIDR
jgi:soluble epoxide hydrolase / lipid-phosphate phosphatase